VTNLFGELDPSSWACLGVGEVMSKMDEYGQHCLAAYADYQQSIR